MKAVHQAPDGTDVEVQRNFGKPTDAAQLAAALAQARKATKKGKIRAVPESDAEPVELEAPKPDAKPAPPRRTMRTTGKRTAPNPADAQPTPAAAPNPSQAAKNAQKPADAASSVESATSPAPTPATNRPLPPRFPPTPRARPKLDISGMSAMHVVEAALFSAGKPLLVDEICAETKLSPDVVKKAIAELQKSYEGRDTVLEVSKAGAKWAMQVRSRAAEPAARFAPMEIAPKLLKTLALIAYHQPMKQSDLVDMIGTKVYDHVPELVERGLVRAREEGVTKVLGTTAAFPEYFGLDAEDNEGVRAAMAKLVGLPAPEKKAQASVVYEETQAGEASAPDAAGAPPSSDAEGAN
jgi:segregation and condensation protein B